VYANVLTNDESIVPFLTSRGLPMGRICEEFTLMKHARFKKIAKEDTALSYEPDVDATFRTLQSGSACTPCCCEAIQA